jgi:hypothetical protein
MTGKAPNWPFKGFLGYEHGALHSPTYQDGIEEHGFTNR